MGLTDKKPTQEGDSEKEVYELSPEMILKAVALKEKEAKERAKCRFVGLLHPIIAT